MQHFPAFGAAAFGHLAPFELSVAVLAAGAAIVAAGGTRMTGGHKRPETFPLRTSEALNTPPKALEHLEHSFKRAETA